LLFDQSQRGWLAEAGPYRDRRRDRETKLKKQKKKKKKKKVVDPGNLGQLTI
jgi:hypothetical protein